MWDPAAYLRYGDERSRPFFDLIARVRADHPRTVVDLGCGPGNLTATLADRWPTARIVGLDSSPEMIAKAATMDARAEFTVADVCDWTPTADTDVVVSNAVLQWVPGHQDLLVRWAGELPTGSWLAVQVPGNFDAASHRTLRAVAADPRWARLLVPLLREAPVLDVGDYAAILTDAGCAVDAWESSYLHLLPASGTEHPVLTWLEGTALRPMRAALGDGSVWSEFRAALAEGLCAAYPVRAGRVHLPFRRIFLVAQTGAGR